MENHVYQIRWPSLKVTIFIMHVRSCLMGAMPVKFPSMQRVNIYRHVEMVIKLNHFKLLACLVSYWQLLNLNRGEWDLNLFKGMLPDCLYSGHCDLIFSLICTRLLPYLAWAWSNLYTTASLPSLGLVAHLWLLVVKLWHTYNLGLATLKLSPSIKQKMGQYYSSIIMFPVLSCAILNTGRGFLKVIWGVKLGGS